MESCCAITAVPEGQRRTLQIVLGINIVMFAAELVGGLLAHSTALLADSADMLGDALVYGFSLFAVGRGPRWQARAALVKGTLMGVFGATVLVEAVLKLANGIVPLAAPMGVLGVVALAANVVCLRLLWGHRRDDVNMRSAWICSRNDVLANGAVLVASAGVALLDSGWPDVAAGLLIAALVLRSAVGVIRDSCRGLSPV